MSGVLMQAAQAFPGSTRQLIAFTKADAKPLQDTLAVLEEGCKLVKVHSLLRPSCRVAWFPGLWQELDRAEALKHKKLAFSV